MPPVKNPPPEPDGETRLMASPHRAAPPLPVQPSGGDDERTILYRPKTVPSAPAGGADPDAGRPAASAQDPATGWLVVRQGPGRGRALTLGYGMHALGRADDQRLSLPFGDQGISRERHLVVTYDGRGRRFYVSPGAGSGLAYLDGQPILQSQPLESGGVLALGGTELVFVPFCGAGFDWQEA